MKKTILVNLLAGACLTGVASAAWLRLPTAEAEPVNLASSILIGTQVQSSNGITNADALLASSSAEVATLPAGKSEAVISIGEQQMIDQVSFLNDGVAGKLVISASADLKEWTPLAEVKFGATDRRVPAKFAGAQAKYVRLAFDAATGSGIRNVKLGGPATTKDFKTVEVKTGKTVDVNLTSSSLGAHPVYMFPTPANLGDAEDRDTFKFPKTKERYRTVVYDLGSVRTVKKFNAAYSRVPTKVQAFAFEQLPEKKDWRGKIALDPAIFDEAKPVATAEDARGDGSIQLVPERPVQAQYVALRFEPNYNKNAAVSGLNPDWQGMALAAVVPFAGVARELGILDAGAFTVGAEGDDDFVVYDAAAGGSVPLVLISRSAIALVLQQLGAGSSEADAINTILTAAGFTPISNSAGPNGGQPQSQVAGPSNSGGTTAGLDALGLSAYRGSGGGGGGTSPFQTPQQTSTTDGNSAPPQTTETGGGGTAPLTIAPTSP